MREVRNSPKHQLAAEKQGSARESGAELEESGVPVGVGVGGRRGHEKAREELAIRPTWEFPHAEGGALGEGVSREAVLWVYSGARKGSHKEKKRVA
ncbi:unnamed protein product [Closterium sp. Naga37s-1]|nr:unnamed protein product [Closterium sp. Naga37s-1]